MGCEGSHVVGIGVVAGGSVLRDGPKRVRPSGDRGFGVGLYVEPCIVILIVLLDPSFREGSSVWVDWYHAAVWRRLVRHCQERKEMK